MKNYVKPEAILSGISEGVFAASGTPTNSNQSTDCWIVSGSSVQDWNGLGHVFQIQATHSDSVQHISANVRYTITLSAPVASAWTENSEWSVTVNGNQLIVDRTLLADAYLSGDNVTFKIFANTGDEATTKALYIQSITYVCTHKTNVQGNYD